MKIGTLLSVLLLLWPLTLAEAQGADQDSTAVRPERRMIEFLVDLASPAPADDTERRSALDDIHDRLQHLQRQSAMAMRLLQAAGDTTFSELLSMLPSADPAQPAQSDAAPNPADPSSRASTASIPAERQRAARDSAALLAGDLLAQAGSDEAQAARFREEPFANRRPRAESLARADELRAHGFDGRQQDVLRAIGFSDAEVSAYREHLLTQPPERWGRPVMEWYADLVRTRRAIAASLQEFAASDSEGGNRLTSAPFTVVNPRDHSATLDLRLLRASVPPQWELSIVPVDSSDSAGQPLRVQVAEAGAHYRVDLPAHGRARVATIVTPVGVPAAQTTARWSVEGWIGNELLGGIVQEVRAPASGTAAAAVLPIDLAPAGMDWRWLVAAGGAGLLLLLLTVAVALRRRRRPAGAS